MATNFKLKRSSVASKRPGLSNLELGELALNTYDGFLFTERNGLGITTVANITPWYENYGAESIFYTNRVGIGTTAVPATNQLLVKGGTETDRLNVTGVSTFLDDVTFETTNTNNIVFDKSDNSFRFGDECAVRFGGGNDLKIQHYQNNSYIDDNGAGALYIRSSELIIGKTNSPEKFIRGVQDAQVELYYHNVKKLETTVSGISITGTTDTDNFINTGISTFVGIITASATENIIPFLYSNYSDLPAASSYHGAFAHVHSVGKAFFAHAGAWVEIVSKETNGTVGTGTERYNVGAIDGTSINITGISTFKGDVNLGDADTDNIVFGGDVNSHIIPNTNVTYDLGSTTKRWRTLYTGASTKIDSDIITRNLSVTGLGTFANDVTFTTANGNNVVLDQSDNSLKFGDQVYLKFGALSTGDLAIYHNGTNSHVRNYTGSLILNGSEIYLMSHQGTAETYLSAVANSSVSLHYDNVKRLSTSGVGVTVYNQLDVTNINASGIITAVDGNFTGNVSIGGTLTYQDVTNVDSIGIATARVGLDVLSGGINAVGIVTADGLDAIGIQSGGVNITTGIITAINFTGIGNTVTYDSSTKIVSVSVGSAGAGGKFVENNTGIHTLSNVGIGTTTATDKLTVKGDLSFTGALKVTDLALSGSNGNYLKSVGTGVTWASFPTARTVGLQTATANQTSFSFAYNVGFLDVYINGVKLTSNEFTATNGTSVVLTEGAFVGDQVQFISFNTTATGGGGGGSGITDVVQDATPQLGGNLDLNSKVINGSGNIDYTGNFKASGIATATTFVGDLTGNVTGNISGGTVAGTTGTFTGNVTLGDSSSDTISMNGDVNTNILPSTNGNKDLGNSGNRWGEVHAVTYHGSGAHLSGVVTSIVAGSNITLTGGPTGIVTIASSGGSSGVTVQDEGSALSTTGTTLNFVGSGVVASGSGATKTITIAGGGSGNAGFSTASGNFTVNAGVTTVINTFNINTNTKLSEYTVHLENVNGNIQSQKVLVMNYGAGIGLTAYSSEYGIMFHPNQIADIGVVVTAGICSLTATTKSGITGITTFSLTRQDQS